LLGLLDAVGTGASVSADAPAVQFEFEEDDLTLGHGVEGSLARVTGGPIQSRLLDHSARLLFSYLMRQIIAEVIQTADAINANSSRVISSPR
jgi:hypothetical protein